MLALYRCGRQAEALDACRARETLVEEIGVEPGPELQRLHEAILSQEPSLDVDPAAVLAVDQFEERFTACQDVVFTPDGAALFAVTNAGPRLPVGHPAVLVGAPRVRGDRPHARTRRVGRRAARPAVRAGVLSLRR